MTWRETWHLKNLLAGWICTQISPALLRWAEFTSRTICAVFACHCLPLKRPIDWQMRGINEFMNECRSQMKPTNWTCEILLATAPCQFAHFGGHRSIMLEFWYSGWRLTSFETRFEKRKHSFAWAFPEQLTVPQSEALRSWQDDFAGCKGKECRSASPVPASLVIRWE